MPSEHILYRVGKTFWYRTADTWYYYPLFTSYPEGVPELHIWQPVSPFSGLNWAPLLGTTNEATHLEFLLLTGLEFDKSIQDIDA